MFLIYKNAYVYIFRKRAIDPFMAGINGFLYYLRVLCVLFFLVCVLCMSAVPVAHAKTWYGQVIQVLDGDSLLIKREEKIVEIRLYGVDTPEYGQDYSKRAGSYTRKQLLEKIVSVEPKGTDKYGRTVALIRSQGRLINRDLVRTGMAWVYPYFCRQEPLCSELKNLESKARKRGRGLWQLKNPDPPWKWKEKNNN